MKKRLFKEAVVILLIGVFISGCAEKKVETKKTPQKEVVVTSKENTSKKKKIENGIIRYANQSGVKVFDISSDTGEVLDTLGMNDEVMTIGDPDQNSWYQVSINGKRGYIPGQFLSAEKITTTAAAVTNPNPTPVPKDPPKEQKAIANTPKTSTSTTKQSTASSKSSTSTAKPTTPTPTKPVSPTTPTTPVTPTPKPANNCPFQLMTLTTYQNHYGFFYSGEQGRSGKTLEMEFALYPEGGTAQGFLVGDYNDVGDVYFIYNDKMKP